MASVIVIKVNGVDITDDVIFRDAEFNSQVSGSPGACKFRLKDMEYAYEFVVGQTITLDVDDQRVWGGWIQSIQRQYFFPYATAPHQRSVRPYSDKYPCGDPLDAQPVIVVPRALVIEGVDYNILFRKRFCYSKSKPANPTLKSWPSGTWDRVMIEYLCGQNLDLSGDGIDYDTLVETVGQPNPDAKGNPAGGGWSWENAMKAISRYPGAIFYIDPDRKLVYTDVDTPNAEYKLTDTPVALDELGYREMEILYNGANLVNDAMVWGAGQGAKRVKFKRTRDQASIDAHGLWQIGDFRGDMWRQASVDKRSRSFVYGSPQNKRGGKDDAISVSVALFTPTFRVAQKVDFTSGVFGYNDVLPIRRMRITFPTPVEARFDLVLSHAIDEPWDTFEYWFPKIKLPQIVIPNIDFESCPVPSLGAPTFPPLTNLVPIFSDDFDRVSGQPNNGDCGSWADGGWSSDPVVADPSFTQGVGMSVFVDRTIMLKNPVSGAIVIIAAINPSGWAGSLGGGLRIFSGTSGGLQVYLRASVPGTASGRVAVGNIGADPDLFPNEANSESAVSPYLYSVLTRPFYVRAVWWPGYGMYAKVWRQGTREPFDWTVTYATGSYADHSDDPTYVAPATSQIRFHPVNAGSYLQGISVWGSQAESDRYGMLPITTDVGYLGWAHSYWCEPIDDGRVYAVSWGTESESRTSGTASQQISIAWAALGIDYGPGYVSGASSSMSYYYFIDRSPNGTVLIDERFRTSLPSRTKISGTLTVSCSQSGGVGADRKWMDVDVPVSIYGFGPDKPDFIGSDAELTLNTEQGSSGGGFTNQWAPFTWSAPLWHGVVRVRANGSPSSTTVEWEAIIPEDQPELSAGFSLSVAMSWPLDILKGLDPSGGPFMLPNGGSISATVGSELSINAMYEVIPCGSHFCDPSNSGGSTKEERRCEVIAVDKDTLQATIDSGDNWAITLQSGYLPGSVMVFVDGLPVRPALDYVELDYQVGTIAFLNNFVNAAMIEVCYFPDTDYWGS